MVRLSDESNDKSQRSHAAQAAVSEAVFHASEIHEEPLVEQHFGGLSDHLSEDSVEGFLARASQFIKDNPWAAAGTALALGLILGMLTGPVARKPIRAVARRAFRRGGGKQGRGNGRNTLEDEPRSLEDAAYYNPDADSAPDNLSGL